MLRAIDIGGLRAPEVTVSSPGPKPRLDWILISDLVVDDSYQRGIGAVGLSNIYKIARAFAWSKFSPVIVAPEKNKKFAIIDGQHRVTAAALRGIARVPCQIVDLDQAQQAAAFRAINGTVTALTRMQIYAAALVAKEPDAVAVEAICRSAGVIACKYPKPAKEMVKGETVAIASLFTYLRRYGPKILTLALRLITETGTGNVGLVRAPIIGALCSILDAEPGWAAAGPKLFKAMSAFDYGAALDGALMEARSGNKGARVEGLIERIGNHLDEKMEAEAA